jgi:cyanophycinase
MALLSRWTLRDRSDKRGDKDGRDHNDADTPIDTPIRGLDLLPGTALIPDFSRGEARVQLVRLLRAHPEAVGLGVGEGAALVVQGRRLRTIGEGTVTIRLAGSRRQEPKDIELTSRGMADLTQLRRAAVARQEETFPSKDLAEPEVPKGALVIAGGGGMPAEATKRFIDLAGGPDALIVILPTANPNPSSDAGVNLLRRGGAKNIKVLPERELKDVEDPKNLEILRQAGGIWFGGGRQWRFVDAYENTKAHEAFRDLLRRGGVIGGSSAGATIQGEYLCRGSPLNNTDMTCEGYERGLGFLPGVAIDQHFAQRKRFNDMAALVKTYPQLLGIGIDESTAIIVQGSVAEVMGRGEVHFYDRRQETSEGQADHLSVKAGGRYDLKTRAIVSR